MKKRRLKKKKIKNRRNIFISADRLPEHRIIWNVLRKQKKELIENGYSVINPAKVNAMLPEDATWEEYIKVSLTLLSICTGVYMMPGWRESRGAVLEFMQARRNEMQIYEDIPGRLQD
ncbi:MAG: DUF4406 domain-containing protein [Roseburia sp.]